MWIFRMKDLKHSFPINVDAVHFSVYLLIGIAISIVTIWSSNLVDFIIAFVALIFFFFDNRNIIKYILSVFKQKLGKH